MKSNEHYHWDPKQTKFEFAGTSLKRKIQRIIGFRLILMLSMMKAMVVIITVWCEAQASVGRAQLMKLDMLIEKRRASGHELTRESSYKGITRLMRIRMLPSFSPLYTLVGLRYLALQEIIFKSPYQKRAFRASGLSADISFHSLERTYNYPDKFVLMLKNSSMHVRSTSDNPRLTIMMLTLW